MILPDGLSTAGMVFTVVRTQIPGVPVTWYASHRAVLKSVISTSGLILKEEEKLTCKKVRLSDLETVMAASNIKMTPEEREKQQRKTRMGGPDRYNI